MRTNAIAIDTSALGTEVWAHPGTAAPALEFRQDPAAPQTQIRTSQGVPVWLVPTYVLDPDVRPRDSVIKVKVACDVAPHHPRD